MAERPKKVKPKEPILAEWANALLQFATEGGGLQAGPGLLLSRSATGAIITLAGSMGRYTVPARITRVYGMDGSLVEDVRYDAVPFREADTAKMIYATPAYGRMFAAGVAVTPAAVGKLCAIVRVPDENGIVKAELLLLPQTEVYKTRRCTSTTPGGTIPPVIGPDGGPITPPPPPGPPGGPLTGMGDSPTDTPGPGSGGTQ